MDLNFNDYLYSLKPKHRKEYLEERKDTHKRQTRSKTNKLLMNWLYENPHKNNLREFVSRGLRWSDTSQGHRYWQQVADSYRYVKIKKHNIWI